MEIVSKKEGILFSWILWHFFEMPKFLIEVWNNYFIFVSNFFSLPLLLRTFFSPWRRYQWAYPRGFDLKTILEVFFSNTISRILGAMMRVVLIIVGIFSQLAVALVGLVIFLGWLFFPFIIVGGFLFILFF